MVQRDRRLPRPGVPAERLHQGNRAGGRLPRRRTRARGRYARARRRVRTGPALARAGPPWDRSARRRPLRRVRRPRSFERGDGGRPGDVRGRDVRDLDFDARVRRRDLPLPGRVRPARRRRRRRDHRADRRRGPPGRGSRGHRLLVLLRGPLARGGRALRSPHRGAPRDRPAAERGGRGAAVRPLDHLLHRPGAGPAGHGGGARGRRDPRGRARATTAGPSPPSSTPSSCFSHRGPSAASLGGLPAGGHVIARAARYYVTVVGLRAVGRGGARVAPDSPHSQENFPLSEHEQATPVAETPTASEPEAPGTETESASEPGTVITLDDTDARGGSRHRRRRLRRPRRHVAVRRDRRDARRVRRRAGWSRAPS